MAAPCKVTEPELQCQASARCLRGEEPCTGLAMSGALAASLGAQHPGAAAASLGVWHPGAAAASLGARHPGAGTWHTLQEDERRSLA